MWARSVRAVARGTFIAFSAVWSDADRRQELSDAGIGLMVGAAATDLDIFPTVGRRAVLRALGA